MGGWRRVGNRICRNKSRRISSTTPPARAIGLVARIASCHRRLVKSYKNSNFIRVLSSPHDLTARRFYACVCVWLARRHAERSVRALEPSTSHYFILSHSDMRVTLVWETEGVCDSIVRGCVPARARSISFRFTTNCGDGGGCGLKQATLREHVRFVGVFNSTRLPADTNDDN